MAPNPERRLPWEFRIIKFDQPVSVIERTGTTRFNFCNIEGDKILYGLHTPQESFETDFGELIPEGKKGNYILSITEGRQNYVDKVLPSIKKALEEQDIKIVDVIYGQGKEIAA